MSCTTVRKRVLATLISSLAMPIAAQPADEALNQKLESLSRQLQQLKSEVKANEDKSTKWLTIGGDYRFRVDRLRGETEPFTDVVATFANTQQRLQADFFANPSTAAGSSSYFPGMSTAGALTALMQFSQGMGQVRTVGQAQGFVANPANQALIQGMGAFAVPVPAYTPENKSLYTNRLGLDLNARATQDVSVTARLLMYKTFGSQNDQAVTNDGSAPFFADRVGVFDGTVGHVPADSGLAVDRAYATWSNIADRDIWFSVGRRPSTGGASSHLRQNGPRPGTGGVPSLLVDYAFDGATLGYAPDIDGWPGAYGKICYGRGFESGYRYTPGNSLQDTDMIGVSLVPIDTDRLRVWAQWNRGMNIFDAPAMRNTYFGDTAPKTNLGDIDWFGAGVLGTLKNVGRGDLNLFADFAVSKTHPNDNVSAQFGFQGLMTGAFFQPEAPSDKTGWALAIGLRYDLPSRTKLGLEFNHGSKNWITFAPAADDIWTAKQGTRGNVYEAYVIKELALKPVSSPSSKAFFRFGAQYYDFHYTGSNNWVGAPVKMSEVNGQMMTLTPVSKAYDLYATFEVRF